VDNLTGWLDVDMLRAKGVSLGGSVLAALLILVLGRLAARVVATALSRGLQRSHTDVTLVKFLYNLVYALLMAFIVVAALEKIGVSTTSFVGIVAAAGLAIGLALQGSLSNFAAGVMIILCAISASATASRRPGRRGAFSTSRSSAPSSSPTTAHG